MNHSRTISINFRPEKVPSQVLTSGTRFAGVERSSIIEFSAPNHVWIDLESVPVKDMLLTFNNLIHAQAAKVKETSTAFLKSLESNITSARSFYNRAKGRKKARYLFVKRSIFAMLNEIEIYGNLENKLHDAQREIQHLKGKEQIHRIHNSCITPACSMLTQCSCLRAVPEKKL